MFRAIVIAGADVIVSDQSNTSLEKTFQPQHITGLLLKMPLKNGLHLPDFFGSLEKFKEAIVQTKKDFQLDVFRDNGFPYPLDLARLRSMLRYNQKKFTDKRLLEIVIALRGIDILGWNELIVNKKNGVRSRPLPSYNLWVEDSYLPPHQRPDVVPYSTGYIKEFVRFCKDKQIISETALQFICLARKVYTTLRKRMQLLIEKNRDRVPNSSEYRKLFRLINQHHLQWCGQNFEETHFVVTMNVNNLTRVPIRSVYIPGSDDNGSQGDGSSGVSSLGRSTPSSSATSNPSSSSPSSSGTSSPSDPSGGHPSPPKGHNLFRLPENPLAGSTSSSSSSSHDSDFLRVPRVRFSPSTNARLRNQTQSVGSHNSNTNERNSLERYRRSLHSSARLGGQTQSRGRQEQRQTDRTTSRSLNPSSNRNHDQRVRSTSLPQKSSSRRIRGGGVFEASTQPQEGEDSSDGEDDKYLMKRFPGPNLLNLIQEAKKKRRAIEENLNKSSKKRKPNQDTQDETKEESKLETKDDPREETQDDSSDDEQHWMKQLPVLA